jgi:hypothetical protein
METQELQPKDKFKDLVTTILGLILILATFASQFFTSVTPWVL